jgi:hypothetical protein
MLSKPVIKPIGSTKAGVFAVAFLAVATASAEVPDSLDDATFWNLVTTLSEPEGRFAPQYMSNEDSLQFVLPELVERAAPGGVYIGVGSEQNFTYLAALQPSLAFIVDIRRDNLLQVLLYKALFEIAPDRTRFVSMLFSRPPGGTVDANAEVEALFDAFAGTPADSTLYEATRTQLLATLIESHGFPLDAEDRAGIVRIVEVFRDTSPAQVTGFGDLTIPSFGQRMAATVLVGRGWGCVASGA